MPRKKNPVKKIVLAYSGGLDTSVILRWLIENYHCEVVAFAADLGQGEDLEAVRTKAIATGASKVYIEDVREEFVRDYVFPMFRAGAIYESGYLMGTSIARPLIAKKQMEVAAREKADAVSHGATGKGNDQVRFELTYMAIDPRIRIIAPWREWDLKSRTDCINYAAKHKIPVEATSKKPYSMDANLLHISFEGGILEDPWNAPGEEMFRLTVSPEKAPDKPEVIEIEIEKGNPTKLDGKKLSPARMLAALNKIGGRHGVGRVDMVENRFVGMKSRGVYETPGGTLIYRALRELEQLTLDREVVKIRNGLIPQYASLVYNGFWFSPERELLQRLFDAVQERTSGTVRLKLYKGNVISQGKKSPNSLYNIELVTFEADNFYDQSDADGFIRLNALRLKLGKLIGKQG